MTKKEENEFEQRLLNGASLDDLIKMKMEEELNSELQKIKEEPKIQIITDISKVPKHLIFSSKAVYRLFNRINKTETFINGLQAEAMLGLQSTIRAKILAGEMSVFSTEDTYVKFEKIEC